MINPLGKLLGNCPWDPLADSPENESTPLVPQPPGTKLLAEGEGKDAEEWNRALVAVQKNNDRLVERLMSSHSCSPTWDTLQVSAGSQITEYQVDGWAFILPSDTFLYRYTAITVEKEGGGQPHSRYYDKETGVVPRVTSMDDGAGSPIPPGLAQHVSPKTITVAAQYSVESTTNWEEDENVVPDLICKIDGSTNADHDGNYRILQPKKNVLELSNAYHRLRMPGISGSWVAGHRVELASDPGVWGYIVDVSVPDGWVELIYVPEGRRFDAGIDVVDGIVNTDSSEMGTLLVYQAPEDPVILEPAKVVGATAEVLTNAGWYYRPRFFFDEPVKAEIDRDTYFHFHYYTPNYHGAATPSASSPLDSTEVMQALSLFMQSEDDFHQTLLREGAPFARLGFSLVPPDTWNVPPPPPASPELTYDGAPGGRLGVQVTGSTIEFHLSTMLGLLVDIVPKVGTFAAGDVVQFFDKISGSGPWLATLYDAGGFRPDGWPDYQYWLQVILDDLDDLANLPAIGRITSGPNEVEYGVQTGTAQSGGASTIQLDPGASTVDDFYNEWFIEITGGTGVGQIERIDDYVGATQTATIYGSWTTPPDATSQYTVMAGGLRGVQIPEFVLVTDGRVCHRWYAPEATLPKASVSFPQASAAGDYAIYVDAVYDDGGTVGFDGEAGWYAKLEYTRTDNMTAEQDRDFTSRYLILCTFSWTGTTIDDFKWVDMGAQKEPFGEMPELRNLTPGTAVGSQVSVPPSLVAGRVENSDQLHGRDMQFKPRIGVTPLDSGQGYSPYGFQFEGDASDGTLLGIPAEPKALFGAFPGGGDLEVLLVRPDLGDVFSSGYVVAGLESGAEGEVSSYQNYENNTPGSGGLRALAVEKTNDIPFEIGEPIQSTSPAGNNGRVWHVWRLSTAWLGEPGMGRDAGLDDEGDGALFYPGGAAHTVGFGALNWTVLRLTLSRDADEPEGGQFQIGEKVTAWTSVTVPDPFASEGTVLHVGTDYIDILVHTDGGGWGPATSQYVAGEAYSTGSGAWMHIEDKTDLGVRGIWTYINAEGSDRFLFPVILASLLTDGGRQETPTPYIESVGVTNKPALEVPDLQLAGPKIVRKYVDMSQLYHAYDPTSPQQQIERVVRDPINVLANNVALLGDMCHVYVTAINMGVEDQDHAVFGLDLPEGVTIIDAGMHFSVVGSEIDYLEFLMMEMETPGPPASVDWRTYFIGGVVEPGPASVGADLFLGGMEWSRHPWVSVSPSNVSSPYGIHHKFTGVSPAVTEPVGTTLTGGTGWEGRISSRSTDGTVLMVFVTDTTGLSPGDTSVAFTTPTPNSYTAGTVYGNLRTTGVRVRKDRILRLFPRVAHDASDAPKLRIEALWVEYMVHDLRC